eukprot:gene18179-5757_t
MTEHSQQLNTYCQPRELEKQIQTNPHCLGFLRKSCDIKTEEEETKITSQLPYLPYGQQSRDSSFVVWQVWQQKHWSQHSSQYSMDAKKKEKRSGKRKVASPE